MFRYADCEFGFTLTNEEQVLLEGWTASDPVSNWERTRDRRRGTCEPLSGFTAQRNPIAAPPRANACTRIVGGQRRAPVVSMPTIR